MKKAYNLSSVPHKEVKLSEISEFGRARKDYGDIEALKADIRDKGIIHVPAIMKNDGRDPNFKEPYLLVAGGRRFRCIRELAKEKGEEYATFRLYPPLAKFDLHMLELSENLNRKALTFQEDCALKAKIDSLYKDKFGVKTRSQKEGHSAKDTADILGVSKSTMLKDLDLQKAMNDIKSVDWNQFETKSDAVKALKTIKKKAEVTQGTREAKRVLGKDKNTILTKLADSYIVGDCVEGMKKIGSQTMNLAEIDPPYAIDLNRIKKGDGANREGYNEVDVLNYIPLMRDVFDECYRILKKDSWLLCWYAPEPWSEIMFQLLCGATVRSTFDLYDNLEKIRRSPSAKVNPVQMQYGKAQFYTNRMSGIWVKPNGQTMQPSTRLANTYETFFYARKGKAELNMPGRNNTFIYNPVPPTLKTHSTERPYLMIRNLLEIFGKAGDRVIVPFAGSGKTLIAAGDLNMIPVGFDLTKDFKDKYLISLTKKERN